METATFLVKICSSPFFNSEAAHWASLISQTPSSITFNHNNEILCSEMLVDNYNLTPQSVNNNVLHSSFLSKIDLEQNKEIVALKTLQWVVVGSVYQARHRQCVLSMSMSYQ